MFDAFLLMLQCPPVKFDDWGAFLGGGVTALSTLVVGILAIVGVMKQLQHSKAVEGTKELYRSQSLAGALSAEFFTICSRIKRHKEQVDGKKDKELYFYPVLQTPVFSANLGNLHWLPVPFLWHLMEAHGVIADWNEQRGIAVPAEAFLERSEKTRTAFYGLGKALEAYCDDCLDWVDFIYQSKIEDERKKARKIWARRMKAMRKGL